MGENGFGIPEKGSAEVFAQAGEKDTVQGNTHQGIAYAKHARAECGRSHVAETWEMHKFKFYTNIWAW